MVPSCSSENNTTYTAHAKHPADKVTIISHRGGLRSAGAHKAIARLRPGRRAQTLTTLAPVATGAVSAGWPPPPPLPPNSTHPRHLHREPALLLATADCARVHNRRRHRHRRRHRQRARDLPSHTRLSLSPSVSPARCQHLPPPASAYPPDPPRHVRHACSAP